MFVPPSKEKILLSEKQIARRIRALAQKIDRFYSGRDIVLIGVLNGSIIFLADLIRHLKVPLQLDSIAASSYGLRTSSSKKVLIHHHLKISLRGAHVLLVDDILDSGHTIARLIKSLKAMHPASLELCVLLRKKRPRKIKLKAKFVGFDIPNHFVYGYGLDYAEQFRNLRNIVFRMEAPFHSN